MGTTTDFKVGFTLEYEGAPWKITEFQHIKPGKGAAFVRSKMKNIQNGATLEKTWRAGESFPDAQVDKKVMKFSYIDAEEHVFMDMESFEEGRIKTSSIDKVEFIKEEMELNVLYYKGIAIDVQIPGTMSLRVKSLESGGSGKDHLSKIVELENGMMMSVSKRRRRLPACRARKYAMGKPITKHIAIAEKTKTNVRTKTPRSGPFTALVNTSCAWAKSHCSGFHCGTASRNIGSIVPNAMHATA
jgi:elongation factor P